MSLTTAVLKDKITKKTGIPRSVVAQVVDTLISEMAEELLQQGTVKLSSLFTISTATRPLGGFAAKLKGGSPTIILLRIRPMESFRKRLNTVRID